jgi:virginiamycin B lyase
VISSPHMRRGVGHAYGMAAKTTAVSLAALCVAAANPMFSPAASAGSAAIGELSLTSRTGAVTEEALTSFSLASGAPPGEPTSVAQPSAASLSGPTTQATATMSVGSTSAVALLKQTLESTVYANGSVSLDNVGTEVSYEFTDPFIKVHLLQSGRDGQSVEITLAFKDFQVQVGTSTVASAGALSEYPAGVGPGAGNGALPQEVTVGADGNIWYTDEVSGVYTFSPMSLQPVPCPSPSQSPAVGCAVSGDTVAPAGIVAGPDGALWFTQSNGGNPRDGRAYFPAGVGRLTTSGAYTFYRVPASANSVPGLDAIAVGPNGNLWFTETAIDRIGEITPRDASPVIHEFALPAGDRLAAGVGSPITSADTIAAGLGNDIWFTEQGSNAIGVMSTSGDVLKKFIVPNANLDPTPLGITEGADGTMWFTENGANQVASITAEGKITVHPLPSAAAGPQSIVYGPDGELWFTENTGVASIDPRTDKVTVYRAHTADPSPVGITVGPDCTSIWFAESSADILGRVAPVPNTTGCKPR